MNDFLHTLYLTISEQSGISQDYQQKSRALDSYHEKIKRSFGLGFLDELSDAWKQLTDVECEEAFRAGLHFGVLLLTSALADAQNPHL